MITSNAMNEAQPMHHASLSRSQVDQVTEELWARNFYGLNRTHILLLVARRHPGFRCGACME